MLSQTRARGYATRDPKVRPVSNTIAVPVFDNGRVVATVGLTFISSVLRPEQAVREHLDQVKDISRQISSRLARLNASSDGGKVLSGSAHGQAAPLPN